MSEEQDKHNRFVMAKIEENGRLVKQLCDRTQKYIDALDKLEKKAKTQIRREGNIIHFVPSYAVRNTK